MPRKKGKRINGRRIEGVVAKALRQTYNKWWVYRYNENRRNPTPGDIQVQTPKYDVILEVKATSSDKIHKPNIRESQVISLTAYHKKFKRNLAILVFYYDTVKKYVMVDITLFKKFKKSSISYEEAKKIGFEVNDWGKVNGYFRRVHSRKRKISSGR